MNCHNIALAIQLEYPVSCWNTDIMLRSLLGSKPTKQIKTTTKLLSWSTVTLRILTMFGIVVEQMTVQHVLTNNLEHCIHTKFSICPLIPVTYTILFFLRTSTVFFLKATDNSLILCVINVGVYQLLPHQTCLSLLYRLQKWLQKCTLLNYISVCPNMLINHS